MKRLMMVFALLAATLAASERTVFAQSNEIRGEIKKVDKAQGKVTVKHGPIKNLDMDEMTMVFRVKEPKMMDTISPGDKVLFEADRLNGQLTITKIKKAK